jgi:hypothetical protein
MGAAGCTAGPKATVGLIGRVSPQVVYAELEESRMVVHELLRMQPLERAIMKVPNEFSTCFAKSQADLEASGVQLEVPGVALGGCDCQSEAFGARLDSFGARLDIFGADLEEFRSQCEAAGIELRAPRNPLPCV